MAISGVLEPSPEDGTAVPSSGDTPKSRNSTLREQWPGPGPGSCSDENSDSAHKINAEYMNSR